MQSQNWGVIEHPSGISLELLQMIESLFWALFWRHDFRMFLSVEVLRNLPFVQSRKRPFMLFSYSCIPNRRLRRSPHFQTSVSMVDLQAMCFLSMQPQVVARQPFYENFTKFLQWLEKSLGICEKMWKSGMRKDQWEGNRRGFQPLSLCDFLFGNKTKDSLYNGEGCLKNSKDLTIDLISKLFFKCQFWILLFQTSNLQKKDCFKAPRFRRFSKLFEEWNLWRLEAPRPKLLPLRAIRGGPCGSF